MLTWSDVLYYARLFLRWWYVLALAVLLAAGTAWYMTRKQPDIYFAQATLMVGNNFEAAAPSQAQVALSNVLADFYAALAKREVILAPVAEKLQLSFPWYVIRDRMLQTRVDRSANLLEIKITDTNPERGAAIANAIAEALIAYTPNAPEKVAAQQAEINRQLKETQANIRTVEAKIAELEARLANLSSAIDIADVQSQLEALQRTRQRYLDEYTNLINLSNQTSVNTLSLFEAARPATAPLPKKRQLTIAMAGAGGLLIAIVAMLLLDQLDERWSTGSELHSRTRVKSLGTVSERILAPPRIRPSDEVARYQALNAIYTNIVAAANSRLPRTLMISSPHPKPIRSALSLGIAESYARTGHRVLLIDMESESLYIPSVITQQTAGHPRRGENSRSFNIPRDLWAYVRPTSIPNLLALSGRLAGYERFSALVPLALWPDIVAYLRTSVDVVIFDGPSALTGPEAALLAPLVDAIVLALNGKEDPRSAVIQAQKQLTSNPDARLLGAVIIDQLAPKGIATPKISPNGGSFKIALSSRGITITFGHVDEDAGTSPTPSVARPLLQAPDTSSGTNASGTGSQANAASRGANDRAGHLTWEDLLELERSRANDFEGDSPTWRPSDAQDSQEAAPGAPPTDKASSQRTIVTPPTGAPPSQARQTYASHASSGAFRPGKPRRARIANSRRAEQAKNFHPSLIERSIELGGSDKS